MFFFSEHHILTTILFTPLMGALALCFVPSGRADLQRKLANAIGLLGFIVSLPLLWEFKSDSVEPFQFIADANWIPSLGVHFRLGVDGLSVVMVLLSTLLGAIAISSSWSAIRAREKEFYVLLLLLQTTLLGVFMSLDFVLFYVFWELVLLPLYLLVAVWGNENRAQAALKFFLYTLAGSVVMLLSILAIYFHRGTFDMREILLHPFTAQSGHLESWLFWGFFLAFAIKLPLFPFHTWLPDALSAAPGAVSLLIAGVVLKTGAYGFLRFSVPMFPGSTWEYRSLLIALSLIAIVYGALACIAQQEIQRLIAYATISQMGLCALGIFALTPLGLYGSVILQVSHELATGELLLVAGILYQRRGSGLISEFGGLAKPMPKFAAIYAAVTLASLGLPLFSGFIGELTILRGTFEVRWYWSAWSLLGMILLAGSLLWLYQRIIFGAAADSAAGEPLDLNKRELASLIPLVLLSLWIGIYPSPLFHVLKQPVARVLQAVHPGTPAASPTGAPGGSQ